MWGEWGAYCSLEEAEHLLGEVPAVSSSRGLRVFIEEEEWFLSIVPLGVSPFSLPPTHTRTHPTHTQKPTLVVSSIVLHPSCLPPSFLRYYLPVLLSSSSLTSPLRLSLCLCSSESLPFQSHCLKRKFPVSYLL